MVRDTANGLCTTHDKTSGCRNEVNRTVYDGDQVLYDIRTQADTVGDNSESEGNGTAFTGVVGYTHAGGIDAPLGLFKGTDRVWTLTDWRGQYDLGVCGSSLCNSSYFFPGGSSTAYGESATFQDGPPSWYGELITGMADGSGLQYRRHRYYNPGSGQFTQEDPIGLAGGLNLYGFANGDPVSYGDPFGLLPCGPGQLCYTSSVVRSVLSRLGLADLPVVAPGTSSPTTLGISGSLGLLSGGCARQLVRDCGLSVNLTPQFGASLDISAPYRVTKPGETGVSASYGLSKHTGVAISNSAVTVSIGVGVGSPLNVNVVPDASGSGAQRPIVGVVPDATVVKR